MSDLADTLHTLIGNAEVLVDLLREERQALTDRDLDTLARTLAAKQDTVATIEVATALLGEVPLATQIADSAPESRSDLDLLHKRLLTVLSSTQEYNAVNGKIVQRTQQSTRELIHLMSGTDTDLLYGEQGQTAAKAQGTAIARA